MIKNQISNADFSSSDKMKYLSFTDLSVANELLRSEDELNLFVKKYSKNHLEIKFLISGYKLILENGNDIELNSFILTKVFPFEKSEKFEIAIKKIDILTTLLTYIFNGPKNHSVRYSAGNGTLFPRTMEYKYEDYLIKIIASQIDVEIDWQLKQEKFLRYSDYFIDHETDALPIFWYGKGLISNDSTSAFLNFYRCVEVLSKVYLIEINSQIRDIIEKKLNIEEKKPEIQKIYKSVSIPKMSKLPLFLEEQGIQKQTYNKWKEFRNKLTHGESLEFNNEFIRELANLQYNTKTILDAKIIELLPEHQPRCLLLPARSR